MRSLYLNGRWRHTACPNEHFMFPGAKLRVETASQQFAQHDIFARGAC